MGKLANKEQQNTLSNKPKEQDGLLQSAAIVSFFTMLSRVLGLLRDICIAVFLGVGVGTDAFFVANKIPNFLRRLFAEGAFAQAFVPVLSEYKEKRSKEEVRELIRATFGSLAAVTALITLLAVIAAPLIIMLFAPGFYDQPEKQALAADMLRLTFPYLFFISLTAFAGSVLNSYKRFAVPAVTPVLLNICLIAAVVFFAPRYFPQQQAMALAWGVLAAGMLQLAFQLPFLSNLGLLVRPKWGFKHEGVRRILQLMLPALFGVSVAQINILLDTVLASFLQTGSISWLYLSDRLMELPLGVFGIAIATVILPSLSSKHANKESADFAKMLGWAVFMVALIGVPAAVALCVMADGLIATLFDYSQFTDKDVLMSAASLRAYAFGLLGFMLVKVLAPGYFARQDTKTPVKIGMQALLVNMVFNLLLVWQFAHVGLALATTIAAFFNAAMLMQGLRKQKLLSFHGHTTHVLGVLCAASVMGVFLWWFNPAVDWWLAADVWAKCWQAAQLVGGGAFIYVSLLLLGGVRPRHLHA